MQRTGQTLPCQAPSRPSYIPGHPSLNRRCNTRAGEEQRGYRTEIDEESKRVSQEIENVIAQHKDVIDWHSNLDVRREMRRDIKRELRPKEDYTEEQLDELANRIVELASRGGHDH